MDGSTSSLYGNYAMGGVINIVTSRPSRRTAELSAQYGNRGTPKFDFFGSDVWRNLGIAVEGSFFDTDGYPQVAEPERGPASIRRTTSSGRARSVTSPRRHPSSRPMERFCTALSPATTTGRGI